MLFLDAYVVALTLLLTATICHSSELPSRKLLQARRSCILHIRQQVKLLRKHSASNPLHTARRGLQGARPKHATTSPSYYWYGDLFQ